jgi:hypothetical protein
MSRIAGLECMWCGTAVETNPSLIEVSEYFPEFEFVISFVLSRPCLCADHLNTFF